MIENQAIFSRLLSVVKLESRIWRVILLLSDLRARYFQDLNFSIRDLKGYVS